MRLLLIDHRDSYTHNLAHALGQLCGAWPTIVDASAVDLERLDAFDAIVLSPGSGNVYEPRDVGRSLEVLRRARVPVLGVCFGHQLIALHAGAEVVPSARPRHGHPAQVQHAGHALFAEVPRHFAAMRYHSWCVRPNAALSVLATSSDDEVMALAHGEQWGVQFHPESVATEHGLQILANFITSARTATRERRASAPCKVTAGETRREAAQTSTSDLPRARARLLDAPFDPAGAFAALQARGAAAFWFDGDDVSYVGVLGERVDHFAPLPPTTAPHPRFAFTSGRVGAFTYELVDSRWHHVTGCIAYTNDTREVFALAEPAPACLDAAAQPLAIAADDTTSTLDSAVSEADYLQRIDDTFDLIRRGEVYQLCLTRPLHAKAPTALALYQRLRAISRAKHGAILAFGDRTLVGNSPETLLVLTPGGIAETHPIKGTRKRGRDSAEDAQLITALRMSPKDTAENLMIVDVARHDLGGVAALGTVTTPELLRVDVLPTVLQLVSVVRAQVTVTAPEVAKALLPPASMTGAPKQRAIEHLRKLETAPRGFYAGAYGWMCDSGAASLAVTIRSATIEKGKLTAGVGGAILLDSDAHDEWQETELKAAAMKRALAGAG